MNKETFTLPPQTTCARCKRTIESTSTTAQDRPRFRYDWISVRNIFTDEVLYYHHGCYNQTMKGR